MKNPFRTLKALVLNRKKDNTGKLISNMDTIRKLIDKDLLFVDCRKPYVCLSLRLHMTFMDDEYKLNTWFFRLLLKLGLLRRDASYTAFMEKVLAYINFQRGIIGLPVHNPNERLDFMVMNTEKTIPIIVGFYQEGIVEYAPAGDAQ